MKDKMPRPMSEKNMDFDDKMMKNPPKPGKFPYKGEMEDNPAPKGKKYSGHGPE